VLAIIVLRALLLMERLLEHFIGLSHSC